MVSFTSLIVLSHWAKQRCNTHSSGAWEGIIGMAHISPPVSFLCPLHISWTFWKIFIKLWSNVCLSETMCRTHNSTMPTRGQGHNGRSRVWAFNFASSSYPWTLWKIFIQLWSNVCLSETMCRAHNSTMPTQGQGHIWRSHVWAFNFISTPYLLYAWEDFY